jgi:hypothetical protein
LILIESLYKNLSVSDYCDTLFFEGVAGSNCILKKKVQDTFTTKDKSPATLDAHTCTPEGFSHFG